MCLTINKFYAFWITHWKVLFTPPYLVSQCTRVGLVADFVLSPSLLRNKVHARPAISPSPIRLIISSQIQDLIRPPRYLIRKMHKTERNRRDSEHGSWKYFIVVGFPAILALTEVSERGRYSLLLGKFYLQRRVSRDPRAYSKNAINMSRAQ